MQYLVFNAYNLAVLGIQYLLPSTMCIVFDIRYLIFGAWYLVLNIINTLCLWGLPIALGSDWSLVAFAVLQKTFPLVPFVATRVLPRALIDNGAWQQSLFWLVVGRTNI